MIKNIRWPIYTVAITLTLIPMLGSLYAVRGILETASTLGISPAIQSELSASADSLKLLAKLDPAHANSYRSEFNHLQETRRNYDSLIELSPALNQSYLEIFYLVLGVSIILALALSTWLNRKIIQSHDQATSAMRKAEERNLYLENREAWRLIAQKFVHEVKNPLTPIKMMVGQLTAKYRAVHLGDQNHFTTILAETQEMVTEETGKITRWVEAFSQYAQTPNASLVEIDLRTLIEEFAKRHLDYWPHLQFKIEIDAGFSDYRILGDPMLLKQILFNLAKNSAEASKEKPVTFKMTLKLSSPTVVSVQIADNGPGLPPEMKKALFQPYPQHRSEKGGMGLGLAINRKLMVEQNGEINYLETPFGCAFELKLPYSLAT